MKSRVLLSIKEDQQEEASVVYRLGQSFCLKEYFSTWFSSSNSYIATKSSHSRQREYQKKITDPKIPTVNVLEVQTEVNRTTAEGKNVPRDGETVNHVSMYPDMKVLTQIDMTQIDKSA